MARVTVRVSDLTGNQISDETQASRLIVEHPDYPEPVGLDVLTDEVTPHLTEENSQFVVVSLQEPENQNPQRYVMAMSEFNHLFTQDDVETALEQAYSQQQQEQQQRRGGSQGSRRQGAASGKRERVDFSSPEHAGEPHRGTISEAEKEYVRDHLQEVNQRLRDKRMREINPNDSEMAERYGLLRQPQVEADT